MLSLAEKRVKAAGWSNVMLIHSDIKKIYKVLGVVVMSYEQFCLLFGQKDQVLFRKTCQGIFKEQKRRQFCSKNKPEGRDRFLRLFIQST